MSETKHTTDYRNCLELAGQIAEAVERYDSDYLPEVIIPHLKPVIGELDHLRSVNADLLAAADGVLQWVQKKAPLGDLFYEARERFAALAAVVARARGVDPDAPTPPLPLRPVPKVNITDGIPSEDHVRKMRGGGE